MRMRWQWTMVACLTLAIACGDDDDDEIGDAGLDGSMMSMTGGTGGGGTSGGSGGTSSSTPRVMCGDRVCSVPGQDLLDSFSGIFAGLGFALPGGLLPMACCTDEDDACGLVAMTDGGSMCLPPPDSDPRCPDVNFLGTPLASCCLESTGVCGVNTAQFGGGCVEAFGGLGNLFGMSPAMCGDGGASDIDGGDDTDGGS